MAEEKKQEFKFPSEMIDLPSRGKLYPKDHPLSSGKIEIKYMTAREEDILTSQNLIRKGVAIDKLLDSLILTKGVVIDDLIVGDKNAIMVAARILAYGSEYVCDIPHPTTGDAIQHTFDLTKCPFVEIQDNVKENRFKVSLPISKTNVTFKLLTGKEEKMIEAELKSLRKINSEISPELTTRLKHTIIDIDGETDTMAINNFVDNLLSRDSLFLRKQINDSAPDINMTQEIEIEGESVKVDIPMTVQFFWPDSQ
jgi:hypothetical protein